MEGIKEFKSNLLNKLKNKKVSQTMTIKEKYNKIIGSGLLLPKDKVSRNGILYDWDSALETVERIPGLPMMYNHQVEGSEKPVGHFTDAIALEERPQSGKWQNVWDKTAEELKTPEGVPGIYYEADINPDSDYANSITRGDVRKVSIQVIPEDQVKETDEETGESYTRAFIKDYVESSVVPSPGFNETTLAVMCESFNVKKVKELFEVRFNNGQKKTFSRYSDAQIYAGNRKKLQPVIVDLSKEKESFKKIGDNTGKQFGGYIKPDDVRVKNLDVGIGDIVSDGNKWYAIEESFKEDIKVGDKVHTPAGYSKVFKVSGNKISVKSFDTDGDFEFDKSQVHKESLEESSLNIGDRVRIKQAPDNPVTLDGLGTGVILQKVQGTATEPNYYKVKFGNIRTIEVPEKKLIKESLEEHMSIGDEVNIGGKKMVVIRTTENGYIVEYPEGLEEEYEEIESLTDEEACELEESFNEDVFSDAKKADYQDMMADKLFRKKYNDLTKPQKADIDKYLKTRGIESLQEDHMSPGDKVMIGGKEMEIAEETENGYLVKYVNEEQMSMDTAGGGTGVMLAGRDDDKEFYPDYEMGKTLDPETGDVIESLTDEEACELEEVLEPSLFPKDI